MKYISSFFKTKQENDIKMEGNMGKTIVEFQDVTKIYGTKENKQLAVDHIDFKIEEGEFVVILGQSGAGKSTVLNMLGGMDQPTSGKVIINGEEISKYRDNELSDYRAFTVGFIFQFYNLLPSLTALENVALTKDIVKDALSPEEMLTAVGLGEHMHKFPAQMSGGEQQRVSIARALSKNPKVILGDEPTGALDSETGVAVLKLLQDMCKKMGKTVIMVTHNADFAQCADRVIRMKNGKIRKMYCNESPVAIEEVEW